MMTAQADVRTAVSALVPLGSGDRHFSLWIW